MSKIKPTAGLTFPLLIACNRNMTPEDLEKGEWLRYSSATVEVPSGGATCYRTDFAGGELIEKVVDSLAGWSTTSEWETDNVGRGSLLSSR